jgi:sporulation protein YqfC
MDSRKNMRKNIARALELPDEIGVDYLKLSLWGDERLLAENHKGILEYGPGEIVLRSSQGLLRISGRDLTLLSLKADELQITGRITAIGIINDEDI